MLFWHFWNSFLFFWDLVLEYFFASFRIFLGPQPLAKHTPVDAKAHSGTTKAHSGKHAPTNTKARPNRHQSTLSGCALVTVGVCFGTGWGVLSQNTSQPWLVCVGVWFDEWKITRPSTRWVNAGGKQRKTKIIPAKHPDRFYMNLSWSHFDFYPISIGSPLDLLLTFFGSSFGSILHLLWISIGSWPDRHRISIDLKEFLLYFF